MRTRRGLGSPRGAAILAVVLAALASAPGMRGAPLSLAPCRLDGVPFTAACGELRVPEDRRQPARRSLALHVVVLPARTRPAAPDPVFYLTGGPGGAASEDAAWLASELGDVLARRDLVLVDQRGTGASHPLACDLGQRESAPQTLLGDPFTPEKARACAERLAASANLAHYTTAAAAEDLEAVRAALGAERIDLYGVSYGTVLAQAYLRRHADRVRAAVLAGTVTPGAEGVLFDARDAERSLHLLFVDCAADAPCHAAYPDPAADLAAALARLDHGPLPVTIADPASGKLLTLQLDRLSFVTALRTRLYSARGRSRVPRALHLAAAGDFRDMAAATLAIARRRHLGSSAGLYLAVMCSEIVPFLDLATLTRLGTDTFLGTARWTALATTCRTWPRAEVAAESLTPVRSGVPVLLLAGRLDPVAPPYWAEQEAAFLRRSRLIVVHDAAHALEGDCVNGLISHFLDAADVAALDASCADRGDRPAFVLPDAPPR